MRRKSPDMCQVVCVNDAAVNRVLNNMPNTLDVASVFKALADETRLKVVIALSQEELCVCDIAALFNTTIQNASYHLRFLKKLGMATFRRDGKLVHYRLVPEVGTIVQSMLEWRKDNHDDSYDVSKKGNIHRVDFGRMDDN